VDGLNVLIGKIGNGEHVLILDLWMTQTEFVSWRGEMYLAPCMIREQEVRQGSG
jgi:hypothetical protein